MLIVISPAKKLDYETAVASSQHSQPMLLNHAEELITGLQKLAPQNICSLMGLSDKLGVLNYGRFQSWKRPFNTENARQAILAFKGDVYQGLDAWHFSEQDLAWSQDHLRILSGLYGVLRPLDLMQPYRLEMGTGFVNDRGKNLYHFWGDIITTELNKALTEQDTPVLVNLASNEYFKSVNTENINARIVTPVFMDKKADKYRVISFFAKKARGLMSAFIIKNRLTDIESIKDFDSDDYRFMPALSEGDRWVFARG